MPAGVRVARRDDVDDVDVHAAERRVSAPTDGRHGSSYLRAGWAASPAWRARSGGRVERVDGGWFGPVGVQRLARVQYVRRATDVDAHGLAALEGCAEVAARALQTDFYLASAPLDPETEHVPGWRQARLEVE